MAHFPKPFFHPKKNRYYVQLDGKQINLGPEEEEAFRRYHKLMSERVNPVPVVISSDSNPALTAIVDEFGDRCLKHRERRTFDAYQERIQSFLDALDDNPLSQ